MNSVLYSVFISLVIKMTVITAFVLLIKTVLKSKLSSKTHTLIWLIPCIQMLFCIGNVNIRTSASIYNIIPDTAMRNISAAQTAAIHSADPRNIVTLIWLIGVIAITLWYSSVFFMYRKKISKYPAVTDEKLIQSAENIKLMLNISRSEKISLRLGDTAQTMPHTVILPQGYSDGEIQQILLHELCHYSHRDYAKLWTALAIVCINWFNPLIWFAFKSFCADIEMMCDDRVLKLTDSKKQYAAALVKSAMMKNRFVPGASSIHNGKNEVKERVKRIASFKRLKPAWTAAAAFLCVTVSCLCLTDAVSVAVENTVDITSTPEPVAIIPTSAPSYTPVPENASSEGSRDNTNNGYTPSYAPSEDIYPQVAEPIETEPETAQEMSEPEPHDMPNKETYELDDGRTVIVQYDGESIENGYIIN